MKFMIGIYLLFVWNQLFFSNIAVNIKIGCVNLIKLRVCGVFKKLDLVLF